MSESAIHVWDEYVHLPGINSAHATSRNVLWLCAVSIEVDFSDRAAISGRSTKASGNSGGNGEDEDNGGVLCSIARD